MAEEYDNIEELENKRTAKKLPLGWLIVFVGLILCGLYYIAAYTPAFSGWSQTKAYEHSLKE
jgi:hypothetical protein